ncbi:hypothetical protein COS93_00430 [bacterium (Candidatus Gribaldobacteria) CG07_land_8_20_14_0_80_33_18]|uniref:Mur ligase central domain-containing protein n=1 Tax=bacterium (Candidatus Gribaldobacteria) CG07_land_8_20_14_0_80_33_18 TaxID=2014272 RepID=A0A2M6Z456_9BACT|nr:MAG: hypothetical protein COU04_00715 [bacterium (Candidatus Gribaldobacteria) CG10_big_fil_rev_8_21_14_0_10_33_41]PIU47199.1 MAG: hypothetical protein COS93_00430 [bacterium (Candidatus Gribaldobacteria) CG07_land_8_20_14_0_80_33_18]PJA00745.1 MAG: hypothetical protein COX75_01700 [bacterium (Candidatus Gribaldobacteria) CG_4_10_14_0_2_um_filter_33_15]PJB08568.1 MAG: hypothetical protein CO122_01520 [bacterium (Candidatus Gribaldobacteria) CG_4_9_14_3_um_filter_33_9]
MKLIIATFWFLIFTKLLLFWTWLWQLKEYHFGRFKAHFETYKLNKIFSSFWSIKVPKLTKKTIIILLTGILLEILILFYIFPFSDKKFYFSLLILIIFAPLILSLLILLFQIPTVILRNQILKKAKKKRLQFKSLLVIGITGSYGKTSTKEFLAEILSSKFNVLKTKEHINAEIGIAETILNELRDEHEIFICEMGAYERGKIKEVCEMIKPTIGILTGINEQHLSTFGSLENIIKAKFELIESLPADGIAFFNAKNKYCLKLYQMTKIKKFLYGENVKLAGLENIEGAKAVARELGMSEEEIERVCQKNENKFPGIKIKKGINGLNIIDATFSANPYGVISHLDYLRVWEGPEGKPSASYGVNKKVIIMPCLIELGSASKEIHKRIGEKIGEICDLAIITTKDRFKELEEGAKRAEMSAQRILLLQNPQEIFEKIKAFSQPGDVILLESRVPSELKNLLWKLEK